ncbi:MAG: hypothetical protein ACR2GD_00325 [Pyrinomonadaceae bacterium]
MNLELVEKIADAVLYEGYMLYPYRASSVKNRQRFNWGALAPESYSRAQKGTEACLMQTECLLRGDKTTTFDVKVRFLHLVSREIGELDATLDKLPSDAEPEFKLVQSLDVGGHLYQTWQEAVEREIDLPTCNLNQVSEIKKFTFPATRMLESLPDKNGKIVGVIVRTQQEISAIVSCQLSVVSKNIYKLTVKIENQTPFESAETKAREDALMHSLVSTHTILSAKNGEFISLLEPPDTLEEAVAALENIKTYPVLAGNEGEKDCVLSSPIILYDYPQIADESAGDLFDGGEIDEILTLRIMTLTDDEKYEMRGIDDRVRKMLERTETMSEDQLLKMHGAMKGVEKAVGETE